MGCGSRRLSRLIGSLSAWLLLCLFPADVRARHDGSLPPNDPGDAALSTEGAADAPDGDGAEESDGEDDGEDGASRSPVAPQGPWHPFLRAPGFHGHTPWVAPDHLLEDWVGHGRARQLREARFQFHLATAHPSRAGDEGWRDPQHLEAYEDIVLSAWGKVVRDAFEEALGIEEWWSRTVDRATGGSGRERSPWHLRLSPRVSEDRLALKLRLPHARTGLVRHVSFRVRYDWTEDQVSWILKLDDGPRFVHLGFEPDTLEEGDRLKLSVRLAW